jgi:hypothetical protein
MKFTKSETRRKLKNKIEASFLAVILILMFFSSLSWVSATYTVQYPYMPPDLKGDANNDGFVDVFDATIVANAIGSVLGDPNWDPRADLNCDSIVDVFDAVIISQNAGHSEGAPIAYSTRFHFTVPNDGNLSVCYYVLARVYFPFDDSMHNLHFYATTTTTGDLVQHVKLDGSSKTGSGSSVNINLGNKYGGYHLLEFEFIESTGDGSLSFYVLRDGQYAWLSRFRVYVPNYSVNKYEYQVMTNARCSINDDYFLIGCANDSIDNVHLSSTVLENSKWNCSPYDTIYALEDRFCYPMGNRDGSTAYQISFDFGKTNATGLLDFQYVSWSKQTDRIGLPRFSLIPGQTPIYNDTIAQDGDILNVSGPQCSAIELGEFTDAPQTMPTGNSLYIRVAGYDYSDDGANAYCYFKLCDVNVKINATTMLSFWMWVYKTPQSNGHIFIDGNFTLSLGNAHTLRDVMPNGTYLVDQFGERVHPGDHFAPWGSWQHYMLNLSSLCGRTLTYLMVAYDDGIEASGRGGNDQFRAYFDGVQIYDAQDQPAVTVDINTSGSPIPSGSVALVYSAYSNELVSSTNISCSSVLCKALWGKVNIYLCNAGGVWWASGDLQIKPNGWNTVAANVSTPTPKARVYVTWVDMSDNTVHPVSGGQVTDYYSGGNTFVSTNDRGIANLALSTNDRGQNYILAQYTAADGSVFTSGEEFVNATLNKFAVLNLAVSAPSISGTLIKSDGQYFEPLFQAIALNENGELETNFMWTPYFNLLGTYYSLSTRVNDGWNIIARWNASALVSYWILNDTSNNRLVLYTHENITYTYEDYLPYPECYSVQVNGPTLATYAVYNNNSGPTEYMAFQQKYEPLAVNLTDYEYNDGYRDLAYIAQCGDGDPDGSYSTFDGIYQLNALIDESSTVNGMDIVGLYVVGYARVDSAVDYLLDQGAVSLYQLYEAYAPDGPLLGEVQSFNSGNHTTGVDAISFTLHGYNCVYTSRVVDFSANGYVGLASMFVCGSSNTSYYRNICDVYLNASSWLLNNAANYPALSFYSFEQDSATQSMRSTLLKRQACCQAALAQIANATMSAAVDPTWNDNKNGDCPWNWDSWYDKIVRPSFCSSTYSSLCIDNYEDSLYMQTVQAYIQGLEQGSIRQNCTFIDIRASAVQFLWVDGEPALQRTITYRAMNGEYYTFEETHSGDLNGPGLKKFKVEIWEGSGTFQKAIHIVAITMSIYGLISYAYGLYSPQCFAIVGTLETPGAFSIASITVSIFDSGLIGALKSVGITVAKAVESPIFDFLLGLDGLSASSACALAAVVSAAIIGVSVFFIARAIAMECGASPQMADYIGGIFGLGAAAIFLGIAATSLDFAGVMMTIAIAAIAACVFFIAIFIILLWIVIHS